MTGAAPEEHSPSGLRWIPAPGTTDPTKLTTDAVNAATDISRRELAAMRELIETRLVAMDKATELLAATVGKVPSDTDKAVGALRELLSARIDGMDTATRLLAENLGAIPSETDKRISALHLILIGDIRNVQDVATQKFEAIEGTFASNALALTAALAAQKEAAAEQNKSNTLAINKSEQATKEASLANVAQTTSSLASQAATIADLKDRLVRLEAGGLATATARTEHRADTGMADTYTFNRENSEFNRQTGTRAQITTIVAVIAALASVITIIVAIFHK